MCPVTGFCSIFRPLRPLLPAEAPSVLPWMPPPFREAEFDIMFGKGISREGDILDLAAKENIVEKSGAWYAYEGSKIGQGRENAKNFLAANPEICLEIENKVRVKYGLSEDTMMPEASKEAPTELPPVGVDAEDEK